MLTDGEWIQFHSLQEMEAYKKNKRGSVDYPDYPELFLPGWYYVYAEGRYYRLGATDTYLCFINAETRIAQVKEAMKELAEELRTAKGHRSEIHP